MKFGLFWRCGYRPLINLWGGQGKTFFLHMNIMHKINFTGEIKKYGIILQKQPKISIYEPKSSQNYSFKKVMCVLKLTLSSNNGCTE